VTVAGAVLCGGRSSRMGRDKALVPVDGVAMAARVATALRAGGCDRVVAVGGDAHALASLGLTTVADEHPGEGPLGGILTALGHGDAATVVVVGCDMPWLTARVVGALVSALDGHDVAVARAERLEPLCAAWRRPPPAVLAASFAVGERAVHRVLQRLDVVEVAVEPAAVSNVNSPSDLLGREERR
jgi:molybdenum cofactor guanylyltransferase